MAHRKGRRRGAGARSGFDLSSLSFAAKLVLGIVIVITFLSLVQCSIKKPESPTWSTNLVVPVVNRTYPMQELIDKVGDDNLVIDSTGLVAFTVSELLDTVTIDQDNLNTDDLAYSISKRLGPIEIESPTIHPVTVSFDSVSGLGYSLPGDRAVVPDTTFRVVSDMPGISSFTTATFSQGRADIGITNELGLDLDNIIITIVNAETHQVIATAYHPSVLPSGSSTTVPMVLDGYTIPHELDIVTWYHTPLDTVDNVSSRSITTTVTFGDTLEVIYAVGQVPALSRTDTAFVSLAENNRVDTADIAGGLLDFSITNESGLNATVTVALPDVQSGGAPLTIDRYVLERQTVRMQVDLTGYELVPQSSNVPQELSVVATASSPGSGLDEVVVTSADSFVVNAELTDLRFSSITGVFQAVTVTFDDIREQFDLPVGFEHIEPTSAVLTLEVDNGIDLPGQVALQISGNNGEALALLGDVSPRGLASSVSSSIVVTNVADFLSPIPTEIEAAGTLTFGDGSYQSRITENDFVAASVRIDAPLEVIINPATIKTDIESEDIDQEDVDVITDHFVQGRLLFQVTNALPLGATLNMYIGGDSASLYSNPQLRLDSIYVTAAPVDENGFVTDAATTAYQEILLSSEDIKILENETLYFGQEMILDGTAGEKVIFTADNYITVTGRIEVEYFFDGEF